MSKAVGTGGPREPWHPPIFLSKVKVPFFNNHVNTFYLAWHKVKSCFRCIPSKIMIKFACSVMWVIVYHDISWWMYVNSLVVFWSNRTILWIILARTLSTAFLLIHENEWTSSFMIFLKSCVYIKGMFIPEISQLMFIIRICSVLFIYFFFIFCNFKKIQFDIVFCLSQTRVSFN